MNDDRIKAAFGDLNRQAADADPEPSLARLGSTTSTTRKIPVARPRWIPALAAAAALIVAVGAVAILTRGPDGGDVAATNPPSGSVATTLPAVTDGSTVDTAGGVDPVDTTEPTGVEGSDVTTTTDPLEGREPVFAGEGWRVTGVAVDDVLNVRSGPGTANDIVGTLAPDDVNVRLTGWGTTLADGNEWWGVLLSDGTEGWVNNAFLTAPESWTGDVRAEQCGLEPTPDFGQGGPAPDPTDQPNALVGIAHVDGGDCDRYVFVLGDYGPDGTYAPVASFNAFGVEVSEPGELMISLPESVVEAMQVATADHIDGRLVLATTPEADLASSQVSMRIFGSYDSYAVSFRANPARVILDVTDTTQQAIPVVEGTGTYIVPLILSGDNQVEFRGFARPFEAQGNLRIVPITGSVAAAEFAGPSVRFQDGADAAFGASWWPAYGEFSGWINGLTSGTYDLWVYGSECLEGDTPADLARCGVSTRFEIP
jgi:hypothetical protein